MSLTVSFGKVKEGKPVKPFSLVQFLGANRLIEEHYESRIQRYRDAHPTLCEQTERDLHAWRTEVGRLLEKCMRR
ncbi:MAG: hypothetical protein Q4D36_03385 [Bacteroidales bacterium]|nr:hypothetical protein [Bacteroidales bacterium]